MNETPIEPKKHAEGILIAGIGSGSLGLELLKCISLVDEFLVYGADIDVSAAGHHDKRFEKTYSLQSTSAESYCEELIQICKRIDVAFVVPGAEITNRIICKHQQSFRSNGITPLVNSWGVFEICSNKVTCNNFLQSLKLPCVETIHVPIGSKLHNFDRLPCIVKPASQSGGSNLVFIAETLNEAKFFVEYLSSRGFDSCVQEYIDSDSEFTVGVLSSPEKEILSSIALKRNLTSKLSRSLAYGNRVVSSGWSQGRIEEFPEVCTQAERVAFALGSTWALNIQGRTRNGVFIPFEINPRHSGTSYFRALSGVNEILIGLNHLGGKRTPDAKGITPAVYSRVLVESVTYDHAVK